MPIAEGALHVPSDNRAMTIPLPAWTLTPKTNLLLRKKASPTAVWIMVRIVAASTVSPLWCRRGESEGPKDCEEDIFAEAKSFGVVANDCRI